MQNETDIAILNVTDDESLSDYFTNKDPGKSCSLTVTGKFLGLEEGNARISIEAVELDSSVSEPEMEEPTSSTPTGAELVLGA